MLKRNVPGKIAVAALLVCMLLVGLAPALAQEGTTLDTSYDNAVSVEMQLLLGTFKLVATDQAVTAEQAAILLPLWTELQTLTQSAPPAEPGAAPQTQDDATQAQIDDLLAQIQAVMTAEQIQAIADMQITQESAQTIMEDIGLMMGGGQQPPGGGAGGQQPPSDNAQQPGGQPPSDGGPGGDMIQPGLFDALIQVLQKIAGGEAVTFPLDIMPAVYVQGVKQEAS
jgi:hypothetical protein